MEVFHHHQSKLEPKLFSVLKEGYSRQQFSKDLVAGVIVGIVALPLSIAFGIASGVKPEQGLYTAIIAGFLISIFSGSRVQVGGPTGAFIVIVYGVVQQYGYDGLATATLIAGVLLVLMGFSRLGAVIKFIPYPVTVGFTSGIALIIFVTQIRDFFGLGMGNVPAEFIEKWVAYGEHMDTLNPYAIGIGVLSFLIIVYSPKLTRKIPGALIAIFVATAIVHLFKLPIETIGSRFGSVPTMLPAPRLPSVSWELIQKMFSPAIAIAALAGIESLLSAVVADGMTGRRHRSNMELIAQGIANIASPIFGGIPATGAIARTATNIKNGGQTPVAGIIHAVTLLLILLFFGKWASLIPMATLAAILMRVAYNMSEWHLFVKLLRSPRADVTVLMTTFLLTVFIDLVVAIEIGLVLAAFLFMKRMADVTQIGFITKSLDSDEVSDDASSLEGRDIPKDVEVFEIEGPFFFGAADRFKDTLNTIERRAKVLILRMRYVPAIDATALRALEDVVAKTKREGTVLILSGLHRQPRGALDRAGVLDRIGRKNLCYDIDAALERARSIVGGNEKPQPSGLGHATAE